MCINLLGSHNNPGGWSLLLLLLYLLSFAEEKWRLRKVRKLSQMLFTGRISCKPRWVYPKALYHDRNNLLCPAETSLWGSISESGRVRMALLDLTQYPWWLDPPLLNKRQRVTLVQAQTQEPWGSGSFLLLTMWGQLLHPHTCPPFACPAPLDNFHDLHLYSLSSVIICFIHVYLTNWHPTLKESPRRGLTGAKNSGTVPSIKKSYFKYHFSN